MRYDVIVVGAGPAGLSFARALSGAGLSVCVIEKQPETVLADPAYDGREIALTHLSHKIMQELGLWGRIPKDDISLIRHARVLNGNSLYALHFDYEETGKENLGFMLSNHLIRKAAYEAVKEDSNIVLITQAEVVSAKTTQTAAKVTLADGRALESGLLVAADSRFSPVRDMLGLPADKLDFQRVCVVCKMAYTGPEIDTAYECFQYDRTLALLPLNRQHVSVVITLKAQDADALLALSPEDFARDIQQRTEGQFGDMTLVTALYPYPLVATYAKAFYGLRTALIGDAAVGMHPVTAHGFNLGLRGGYTLAGELKKTLAAGGDIGSSLPLARYNKTHRQASRPLYLGTNALVRLYTNTNPLAKAARHTLLRLGNAIGPAKKLIMDQLTEI